MRGAWLTSERVTAANLKIRKCIAIEAFGVEVRAQCTAAPQHLTRIPGIRDGETGTSGHTPLCVSTLCTLLAGAIAPSSEPLLYPSTVVSKLQPRVETLFAIDINTTPTPTQTEFLGCELP